MSGVDAATAGAPRLRPASARAQAPAGDGSRVAVEAFSRGDAIDRDWMGWGALRVLSRQDWAPGATRDDGRVANMERLLLVLDGALDADCGDLGRHRVEAGGALWIGTGHGLESRLANASARRPLRLVEFWLRPDRVNAAPAVAAWLPDGGPGARDDGVAGAWRPLAGVLPAGQRVAAMVARLGPGECSAIPHGAGHRRWLEVLSGGVVAAAGEARAHAGPPAGGLRLAEGDGLGWLAGATGAPATVAAFDDVPAWVLLLALPD